MGGCVVGAITLQAKQETESAFQDLKRAFLQSRGSSQHRILLIWIFTFPAPEQNRKCGAYRHVQLWRRGRKSQTCTQTAGH